MSLMARGILEIDGRRIELTDAQVEELLKGKEDVKKTPFTRRPIDQGEDSKYYYISCYGNIDDAIDDSSIDTDLYNVANYCADKELMEQRALHEVLDRLLWRFSMENDGDKIDWDNQFQSKYRICYNKFSKKFYVMSNEESKSYTTYFYSMKIANRAIEEIIKPFMEEHPEFVW